MQLNLIHLDNALLEQPRFMDRCRSADANQINMQGDGRQIRLWATTAQIEKIRDQLRGSLAGLDANTPMITWYGSGDFHHVTAVIVSLLAERRDAPITVVHFDNHPDWVSHRGGVHCGSWVHHVLESGVVSRVITIGVSSGDLAWPELKGAALDYVANGKLIVFPIDPPTTWVWRDLASGAAHRMEGHRVVWTQFDGVPDRSNPDSGNVAALRQLIGRDAIYVSIDKDVLNEPDAATNWDQGQLRIDSLIGWLEELLTTNSVIGVDVVGDYSPAQLEGSWITRTLKRSELLLDQPRPRRTGTAAAATNQATNLKLMSALDTLLC